MLNAQLTQIKTVRAVTSYFDSQKKNAFRMCDVFHLHIFATLQATAAATTANTGLCMCRRRVRRFTASRA